MASNEQCWGLSLCAAMVLACAGTAAAYEAGTVADGATVTGSIKFVGTQPSPKLFELRRAPDKAYCGALSDGSGYRVMREVSVNASGGLQDVVIMVEGVRAGKPFELIETKVEANVCQFLPFVSVVRNDHPMTIRNMDPVSHDLQVYERDGEHVWIMFHRPALTRTGTTDQIKFTGQRREMAMQCGMHPYMQGHGIAVDNPYYAISDREGAFVISDLPAGTYVIRAWHPTLGVKQQQVTVGAKGAAVLEFVFNAHE